MLRSILLAALVVFSSGCAQRNSLYSWGGYESQLYATYKDPTQAEKFRASLEVIVSESEARSQKVPPGIYAELGTLFLQAGDLNKSLGYYEKERAAWPESRGLMDSLIGVLKKRQQGAMVEADQK